MSIVVKWGRERLHISLPPPDAKLSTIRKYLAEYTHLPEHSFKLIHAGAVMKDDNAPISAYNIHENSTIALVGGGEQPTPAPSSASAAKAPERKSEQSTITQIRFELDKVRSTLEPSVNTFLYNISPSSFSEPPPSLPTEMPSISPEQEHTRLGELLLQSLLRLDAITADGAWEDARAERKNAVRQVQGILDRLDGGWKARP